MGLFRTSGDWEGEERTSLREGRMRSGLASKILRWGKWRGWICQKGWGSSEGETGRGWIIGNAAGVEWGRWWADVGQRETRSRGRKKNREGGDEDCRGVKVIGRSWRGARSGAEDFRREVEQERDSGRRWICSWVFVEGEQEVCAGKKMTGEGGGGGGDGDGDDGDAAVQRRRRRRRLEDGGSAMRVEKNRGRGKEWRRSLRRRRHGGVRRWRRWRQLDSFPGLP